MTNYIDINGWIETYPKICIIAGKTCCEFLLRSKAIVKSNEVYESFSIPVLLSRKNAKRCITRCNTKNDLQGKYIRIQGSLSWNDCDLKIYKGFYIDAEKVIGI